MEKALSTIIVLNLVLTALFLSSCPLVAKETIYTHKDKNSSTTPIWSGSMIYGRVLELTLGEEPYPSAGATVHCYGFGLFYKSNPYNEVTITDENGNYSFGSADNLSVPVPGIFLLYVEKEGYLPSPFYPFSGVAVVRKYFTDGILANASDILPVWPPLVLIQNTFGSTRGIARLLGR